MQHEATFALIFRLLIVLSDPASSWSQCDVLPNSLSFAMNDGNISTSEDVDDLTSRGDSKRTGGISRRPMSPIEKLDYCETALTSSDKGRFMEAVKGKAVGKIWKIVYEIAWLRSADSAGLFDRYEQLSDTMNALRAFDRKNDKMYAKLQDQLRLQAETVRMYFMDLRRRIVEARGDDEAEALRLLDGRLEVVFGDLDRSVIRLPPYAGGD